EYRRHVLGELTEPPRRVDRRRVRSAEPPQVRRDDEPVVGQPSPQRLPERRRGTVAVDEQDGPPVLRATEVHLLVDAVRGDRARGDSAHGAMVAPDRRSRSGAPSHIRPRGNVASRHRHYGVRVAAPLAWRPVGLIVLADAGLLAATVNQYGYHR